MVSFANFERLALCDLLTQLGPDAPTLCEGWLTYDLAAHLVVRDRKVRAWPGYVLPAFTRYSAKIEASFKAEHSYRECVRLIRHGPPWLPVRGRGIQENLNLLEYLIHHEDVRRAQPQWHVRRLSTQMNEAVWEKLPLIARMKRVPASGSLILRWSENREKQVRKGHPSMALHGDPVELALFLFNRRSVAQVDVALLCRRFHASAT